MILAWAHALSNDEILDLTSRLPGLGVVLYRQNYEIANFLPAIAYAPTVEHVLEARNYPFKGFILGRDEPNINGLSGPKMDALESSRQFREGNETLADHSGFRVPASLAAVGGFWRTLFYLQRFDQEFHDARGVASVAWAPTRSRICQVRRMLSNPTVLSPALYRGGNRFLQVSPQAWANLSSDSVHVAYWCLREVKNQPQFGLFDRDGNLTVVGRHVRSTL